MNAAPQSLIRSLLSREVAIAAGTVAAIVLGVTLFVSAGAGTEDAAETRDGVREGRATVGREAPDFRAIMFDGETFTLSDYRGSPVWINVWASWCPPCRAEFPDINEIRLDGERDGLVFIAMNSQEDPADAQNYMLNTGYDFRVGFDVYREFEVTYRVLGLPMHIFIDADGRLNSLRVGGMTRDEMIEKVAELTAPAPQTVNNLRGNYT